MTELEQLQKIIKDAPDGSLTHFDGIYYWQYTNAHGWVRYCSPIKKSVVGEPSSNMQSLDDIRKRISLMKKLEKCQDLIRILTPYMASDSAKVNAKKLIGELNG